MSRDRVPPLRIEYDVVGGRISACVWQARGRRADGRPTEKNLRTHVSALNASFEEGGANALAGKLSVIGARIVRNDTGGLVAAVGEFLTL